jgi:hypothetical protein
MNHENNEYHNPHKSLFSILTNKEKQQCATITGGCIGLGVSETIGIPLYVLHELSAPVALGAIPAAFISLGAGISYFLYQSIKTPEPVVFIDFESNIQSDKPCGQCMTE